MKRLLILFLDYLTDLVRFRRYSAFGKPVARNPRFLQAQMMLCAHGVEKGLSLGSFEPRRGIGKVRTALSLIESHRVLGLADDDTAYAMARDAVASYRRVHAEQGIDISDVVPQPVVDAEAGASDRSVRVMSGAPLDATECAALLKGIATRRSVREYAEASITHEEIVRVVAAARATPSVCNRQGFRVYATTDDAVIRAALARQNGNRGFGDRAPGLFVVTCDLSIFEDPSERNQGFVDGGLFAMSLMLSLHGHGFGSCPLNWSASHRQDHALRRVVRIEEGEVIVMMIAFGKLAETSRAAGSRRYPVEHFLRPLELRQLDECSVP